MEETPHFRDEDSDGKRARETHTCLVETVRSLKEDNQRLMRVDAKKT